MAIERVGYRRLYDAIDCSISGLDEIRIAFPFEDRFLVEIYIGPTPRFGISTEKNDDFYAHPGTETKKNISYHFDVTQSSHPRRFFTEISCFRGIEVSTALSKSLFVKSGGSQSTHHQTGHSDVNHRFATLRKHFIVLAKSSTLGEPGKGAFHHPTSWQDDKAFLIIAAEHWLQAKASMQDHPFQKLTTIGPINPNAAQFLAGPSQTLQQQPGSSRIG